MLNKNIVEIQNVSYKYPNRTESAVEDINLSVKKGEFLGIIGENGSGKTTLLRLMMGLIKPQTGSIKLFGTELNKFKDWKKIGYIPQKSELPHDFPILVGEFITLGLLSTKGLFAKKDKSDEKKIDEALKSVNMLEYKHRKLSELSGGQFQRVLLAKEIVKSPELLVLDEPTVGIDIKHHKKFCCLLSKLNKMGITIIIVTHDISFVSYHVSRIVGLNEKIMFDDKPKNLSDSVLKRIFGHATVYSGRSEHCR